MKQKNLIMLGVAVGCGLIAAIAVAKLSAGGGKAPESVKLLVAKKDIPIDTKLDEKNLDQFIAMTDVPKHLVPLDPVDNIEAIKGKSNTRTLKAGNALTLSDFGKTNKIEIPDGLKQITFHVSEVDGVDGFAKPGSKVDVHYLEKTPSGKTRTAIMLRDMLVLALGHVDRLNDKQDTSILQVKSVSLAVTDEEATMIGFAEKKGTLKLVLRSTPLTAEEKAKKGKLEWIVDPFDQPAPPVVEDKKPVVPTIEAPKYETVMVAKKAVPVNTLLNRDTVAEYFQALEVKKTPEGAVGSTADLLGKFLIQPLSAGQAVYKSATGDKAVEVTKPDPKTVAKAEPKKAEPKTEPTVAEKPVYPRFYQTIVQGGQFKTIVYLEIGPGTFKSFESDEAADKYNPQADKDDKTDKRKPAGTPGGN